MKLYIAEKKDVALDIMNAVGGATKRTNHYFELIDGSIVTWTYGHLLTQCDPEDLNPKLAKWNLEDLPLEFDVNQTKPVERSKDKLDVIGSLIKKASEVVHVGDTDEEGQLIVDEILEYFDYDVNKAKRIWLTDGVLKKVQKEISNPRSNSDPLFRGMSNSAKARSQADMLYGYNMTRLYTMSAQKKGHVGVLSVGRVQTPTLGLVIEREKQNKGHQEAYYYRVQALFSSEKGVEFKANYRIKDGDYVDESNRLNDKAYANEIANNVADKTFILANKISKTKTESAPLPFNLANLQTECNKLFKISVDKTLEITQSLRDNYKLITYNRTDSSYLTDEHHAEAPDVIEAVLKNLPNHQDLDIDCSYKSRAFNSKNVTAHHGIIPTTSVVDLTKLKKEEKMVYELIVRNYLAQFLGVKETEVTEYTFSPENDQSIVFDLTVNKITNPAWNVLFSKEKENIDDEESSLDDFNADLEIGSKVTTLSIDAIENKTKPPKLFTQGTLMTALTNIARYVENPKIKKLLLEKDEGKKDEHGGIGTSATRSNIIKSLIEKGYIVEDDKGYLTGTKIAHSFISALPIETVRPDLTALWHEQQTEIADGNLTIEEFIEQLQKYILVRVNEIKANGLDIKTDAKKCPECDEGYVVKKRGKNGEFFACNQYPRCNYVESTSTKTKGNNDKKHKCPKCSKPLIKRTLKGGKRVWLCTDFSNGCKTAFNSVNNAPKF